MVKFHREMQIPSIPTQNMLAANSQRINNQHHIEKDSGFYTNPKYSFYHSLKIYFLTKKIRHLLNTPFFL